MVTFKLVISQRNKFLLKENKTYLFENTFMKGTS